MKFAFLLGLLLATAAVSFGQVEKAKTTDKTPQKKEQSVSVTVNAEKNQQNKEQRVKIIVDENGKVTKIDTTFNLLDEKVLQHKVDSMMRSLEKDGKMTGEHKVIILRGGDQMKHMKHSGNNQFEVFYNTNDSGKVKHARRIIRMGDEGDIVLDNIEGDMIPPPPPMPPMPPMGPGHMKVMRFGGGDPYAHDPDNADIVSYEKKDIGKGLEKITIVRKKHETPEPKKDIELKYEVKEDKK
jgi:hypothetical protein